MLRGNWSERLSSGLRGGLWLGGSTLLALSGCTLERRSFPGDAPDAQVSATTASAATTSLPTATLSVSSATATGTTPGVGSSSVPLTDTDASPGDAGSIPSPDASVSTDDASAPTASSEPDADAPHEGPDAADAAPSASTATSNVVDSGVVPSSDVHGRVVDFFGHPLANVPVNIGSVNTTTDAQGEFTISSVGETYDVNVLITYRGYQQFVWRYEGLTRRDPMIQAYWGAEEFYAEVYVHLDAAQASDEAVGLAAGGVDGSDGDLFTSNARTFGVDWSGVETTTMKFHALQWKQTDNIPTSYLGYYTENLSLQGTLDYDRALTANQWTSVASGYLDGTIDSLTQDWRNDALYVQFAGGGSIELFNGWPLDDGLFSYLVPSLPNSSMLFIATEHPSGGGGASVFRHGLAAGQNLDLTIPAPPRILTPTSGDTVTAETEFTWTGASGVKLVHIDGPSAKGYYIVTAADSITIPSMPGFHLNYDDDYYVQLETHRTCATTDECAGSQGFLSPINEEASRRPRPVNEDGTYTWSAAVSFRTPPQSL